MNTVRSTGTQPTLQTVDRALSFLEYIADASRPPTVREVSNGLRLNITTCYHLLHTLVARGYVTRHENLTLTVGPSVGALFRAFQNSFVVDESLIETVDGLASRTAETAYLSVLDGRSVVLKILAEGQQTLRVSGLYVGIFGREHRRASGKAVLAHLDPARFEDVLAVAIRDVDEGERERIKRSLSDELAVVRERGWSVDDQQTELGISSIAAPVFDRMGNVFGAVGVIAPTVRMEQFMDTLVAEVRSSAQHATDILRANP